MRNLMKKSLACCLAIALCLTAMVGITVSAAEVEATITVEDVTAIAADDLIVDVDFELAAKDGSALDLSEAFLDASVSEGAEIVGIEAESGMIVTITNGIIDFYPDSLDGTADSAKVTLKVAVPNAVATYTVTVGVADVGAATWGEDLVVAADATGTITVKAAEPVGPVLDETLASALYSVNMTIGDKFGIYPAIYLSGVEYDSFEFVVSKKELDGATYEYTGNSIDKVFTPENCESNSYPSMHLYYYNYTDVALYEMGVDITFTLYIIKDGAKVSYYTFDPITFASVAKNFLNTYISDPVKNAKQVAMGTDLLNVATAAQTYFASVGSANSPLHNFPIPNEGIDQQYATSYETLTAVSGTQDAGLSVMGLQLLATPSLRYQIYDTTMKTPANVTITASYDSLGLGYVSDTVNGAEMDAADNQYGTMGLYYFTFAKTALYDGNKLITLEVTDGSKTLTFQSSLDAMLLANINNTTAAGDVYRAVASLSACTRVYFPTL